MSGSIPSLSLYVLMITLYFTCYFRRTESPYHPRLFFVISIVASRFTAIGGSNPREDQLISRTVRSSHATVVQTTGWHEIRGVGEAQRSGPSLFTLHAVGRDDTGDTLNVQCSAVYTAGGNDTSALMDKCVACARRFFFLVRIPG